MYRRLKNKYFSIDEDAEAADAARCPLFGAGQIVQTRHRLFAAEINDQQERFLCLWLRLPERALLKVEEFVGGVVAALAVGIDRLPTVSTETLPLAVEEIDFSDGGFGGVSVDTLDAEDAVEIGRASCRERV